MDEPPPVWIGWFPSFAGTRPLFAFLLGKAVFVKLPYLPTESLLARSLLASLRNSYRFFPTSAARIFLASHVFRQRPDQGLTVRQGWIAFRFLPQALCYKGDSKGGMSRHQARHRRMFLKQHHGSITAAFP